MDNSASLGGMRNPDPVWNGKSSAPLVSVITAVYNGSDNIEACLNSVLAQDYSNLEHIVMDGGSTDGTVDILRRYDDRLRYWKSERDDGVYDAWNKALKAARGEWICFLGADDEFLPGAIQAYMLLAASHPEAEYLSSRETWVHPSGYTRVRGGAWNWKDFSRWMCAAHVGSMHRRSLYARVGVYDPSFGTAADYELLLRARDTLRAAYMPTVTVLMRGGGMTDKREAMADATRAKILTGRRNALLATLELWFANVKYYLRPLRRAVERMTAR